MKKKILSILVGCFVITTINSYVFAEEQQQTISIEPQVIEEAQAEMDYISPLREINPEEYYKEYMQVVIHYADQVDPPETIYDYYSDEEVYLIQRCVETEVHGADFMSKVNVANVILNRVKADGKFGSTPSEVIIPGQFVFGRTEIDESTKRAVEFAFMFKDTTDGALYFQSIAPFEHFSGADYMFTDQAGHHFYK